MDKYSFKYITSTYELIISRKYVEIFFILDQNAYVLINRISLERNITFGDLALIEQLINGDYLTHDGLLISINDNTYEIKITFLEDNSYVISKGDGKIELLNNGFLDFYDDDRDFILSPAKYKKKLFSANFNDYMRFNYIKYYNIDENAEISYNFSMDTISFFDEFFSGELIGINNKYRILEDNYDKKVLIPLYNDITINNLDDLFQ